MSTTLTNGLKLPDKGSVDWYTDMQSNYTILDGAVGTVAEHSTQIAGKAPLVHTHTKSDITDFPVYGTTAGTICEGNDSRLSDARTPVAHTHTKSNVTDLLNSNFIPSANNSYDLGSSSYQWNNLYAKNYFYNGTAWGLDKSNWWSQAQFYAKNSIHVRNVEPGVAPSSDVTAGIRVENANATYAFADIVAKVFTSGITFVNLIASNKFSNGALDPNGTSVSRGLQVGIRPDGTGFIYTDCGWRSNLFPHPLESGVANLGTSSLKWKTLNGINPGALSLPDYSKSMNVDTTGWSTSAGRISYTPTVNGWLQIAIPNDIDNNNEKSNFITIMDTDVPNDGFNNPSGISAGNNNDYRIQITFPVVANKTYYIYIKSYSGNILAVKYIAALGHI